MTSPTLNTISSNGYSAVISSLGAELKSFKGEAGEEYMWSGDPTIQAGTAPVLFPIIGQLKDGQYQYKDKTYQLAKHGLARTAEFELVIDKADEKSFLLTSSPETLKHYPFKFELEVFFSIKQQSLEVRYEVRNTGDETMLFSLGSHPAFALPLDDINSLEDYCVEFESREHLDRYFLDKGLLCTRPTAKYLDSSNTIPITAELFDNDALIFKNIKSRNVRIVHKTTGQRIGLNLGEAPHLGIWAKPDAGYICLEPWFSYDDAVDTDGDLENKPGMLSLVKGDSFSETYSVSIAK